MANKVLEYKGYQAEIEFDYEDSTLYGKVLDIEDHILFEIDNPQEAQQQFEETIEDYIFMCEENGKKPCKPFKGVFNLRISPELHKQSVQMARREGIALNTFVEKAIKNEIQNKGKEKNIVNIYVNNIVDKSIKSNNQNLKSYQGDKFINRRKYIQTLYN